MYYQTLAKLILTANFYHMIIDMNKPVAVLISDVHYSVHTLSLADAATRQAITKANELRVPLIVAGDLHDTKANLRGECVNAMINTFKMCGHQPIILVGNHDRLNEKAPEHALNFLRPYARIVEKIGEHEGLTLLAYNHDTVELRSWLSNMRNRGVGPIIMHQGLNGSNMGDYIKDDTALKHEDVTGLRVISGHYHTRQTINLPNYGRWDFIGNPYSLTFGEANDPDKGYQILYSDGRLEFMPTNLRRHVIIEMRSDGKAIPYNYTKDDLVWVKVYDIKANLAVLNKTTVGKMLNLEVFKFEQICTEELQAEKADLSLKSDKLLDSIIDSLSEVNDNRKAALKSTWRQLCD